MKKLKGMLIPTMSTTLIVVLLYYANSIKLLGEITKELQRYSGINEKHLIFIVLIICGSFMFGYLFTRVGRGRLAQN